MARIKRTIASVNLLQQNLDALTAADAQEKAAREAAIAQTQAALAAEVSRSTTEEQRLDSVTAKKAANLSDLTDVMLARSNINVMSVEETQSAIQKAALGLGSGFVVEDIAARDALGTLVTLADGSKGTQLTVNDTVRVNNGGNWVVYNVDAVDEVTGVATFSPAISKQEWLIAKDAAAVKQAYESNADTNCLTDVRRTKIDYISITRARNLDKLVQSDELNTSPSLAGASNTDVPSSAAVLAAIKEAVRVGGARVKTDTQTVTGDRIVLQFAPKDGQILNGFCARVFDENVPGLVDEVQVSLDATDTSGKTYIVNGNVAGDFDNKVAVVQYLYVEAA